MNRYTADLHIHTVLSPCAMQEMTPPEIVRMALRKGLTVIAICDHNSAENTAAVQEAAAALGSAREALCVIAGIEVTTSEEAHVLGLFPDAAQARAVGKEVCATLPPATKETTARFGEQRVMDARGRTVGEVDVLLAAASSLDLAATVGLIKAHKGVAIAAHLDRPSFSVLSQLGIFPTEIGFDGVEVSISGKQAGRHHSLAMMGLPVIASSDSHFLSEVGSSSTVFEMEKPTFDELVLSLRGKSGRRCFLA